MIYCKNCILPDERPGIIIDAHTGVCIACKNSGTEFQFKSREDELRRVLDERKSKKKSIYDCVIPVSGGKDSTWQTVKALEMNLRPLCVTWRTPKRTEIGERNLQNLIDLGVDHIDFSVNPKTQSTLTRKAFEGVGIPALPMHLALFSIPTKIALNYGINLILWGENSAQEYGGEEDYANLKLLSRDWLKRYGVSDGTFGEDWIDEDLSAADLDPFTFPSDNEVFEGDLKSVFLGMYSKWTPYESLRVAKENGFQELQKPIVGKYSFADIDEGFVMTVHHWIKWYKFGITRTWDNLSLDIRNNIISRDGAIEYLQDLGNEKPIKEIEEFCEYIDISIKKFDEICESFRNRDIWSKNQKGKFEIKDFLVKRWEWNE